MNQREEFVNQREEFEKQFNKCDSVCISIPSGDITRIENWVKKIVNVKMQEQVHKLDGTKEHKRWRTGRMGEVALEILFNKKFTDWSIGRSDKYAYADLKDLGVDVGVKTVEYGSFPLVHKVSHRPEIICVLYGNKVYVMGLATVDVLNTYSNQDYVRTDSARDRKTGFYGFDKLIPIRNLAELKNALNT
jgi:hypothetical protein